MESITSQSLEIKEIEFNIKKEEFDFKMQSIREKEKELEKEILRLQNENEKLKLISHNPNLIQTLLDLTKENNDILKKLLKTSDELIVEEQKEKKSSSPFIQQYNENLQLIGHFDSFIQLTRQITGTSTHGIKNAVQNNSIYHGFRWLILERSQDPTIPQTLEPTKQNYNRKYELLAHVNLTKDKIIKVYSEYADIAKEYKTSNSAISTARRRGSKCNGGYIKFYNECSEEMKKEYEKNNKLPYKPLSKTGISITQLDPISNIEITTYSCISDVTKKFKVGRNKLKEASEKNTICKGFRWAINY